MTDFARRGKAAKRKGENGELEVRDLLREYGFVTAHRNFQSGGQGGGDLADAIPDVHIEVKRTERLALGPYWRQACRDARPTDLVLLVHRGNFQPWQATGALTDLAPMFAAMPSCPQVVGQASPRATFLSLCRETNPTFPCVVHQTVGTALMTVLFTDFLDWQRDQCRQAA